MKKSTLDMICSQLHKRDEEHSRNDAYSGRGMYGKSTAGVVVADWGVYIRAALLATSELTSQAINGSGSWSDLDEFIEDAAGVSWDSMGHDVIIY